MITRTAEETLAWVQEELALASRRATRHYDCLRSAVAAYYGEEHYYRKVIEQNVSYCESVIADLSDLAEEIKLRVQGSAAAAWERKHGNADLIAAAPDMLAALERLEESVEYWSEYTVPLGIVEDIKKAIAKARGEK